MTNAINNEELKNVLQPSQTLIVVIDMQNDFCHPEGAMGVICRSKTDEDLGLIQEMIPRLDAFLNEARKYGAKIVFVQNLHDPKGLTPPMSVPFRHIDMCLPGTWGADFVAPLKPAEGERTFVKYRYNLFTNPDFPTYLRMNRIETLVATGVGTPVCVESTVRHAFMADFNVVVPRDCVATYSRELHRNSLRIMARNFASVVDSRDILDIWKDYS